MPRHTPKSNRQNLSTILYHPQGREPGLGLSLSYDIIKVHNGKIKVESKEGEGTNICIDLPI